MKLGLTTGLKALIRSLDPHGQRVVSANNNAANGKNRGGAVVCRNDRKSCDMTATRVACKRHGYMVDGRCYVQVHIAH